MNNKLKLAICTGIISPFCASAQLITVDSATPLPVFDPLIADMAADEAALGVFDAPDNNGTFTQLYWDASEKSWITGALADGSDNLDLSFQLIDPNVKYFLMGKDGVEIGFVGNENWDLDELYINAYAVGDVGNSDPRERLFQYSDNVAADDTPGNTVNLALTDGTDAPVVLEFEHINQTTGALSLYQSSEVRFNMFQGVSINQDGLATGMIDNQWLFGINDKNNTFDEDGDDGYFYISGDIRPVPEPSQIAALSLLGLGALLVIRRRIVKRRK